MTLLLKELTENILNRDSRGRKDKQTSSKIETIVKSINLVDNALLPLTRAWSLTVLSNIRLVFLLFLKYLNFPRLFTLLKDNKQFHLTKILIKVGPEATKVCCGLMASKIIINKKLEMTNWEYFEIQF